MKLSHYSLLAFMIIPVMGSGQSQYKPVNFEKSFVLSDVQVKNYDDSTDNKSIPKSVKWDTYFSGATLYQSKLFYRIVPKQKTDSPKVDYIDIKSDGTGISYSPTFSVDGPFLSVSKFRTFFEKQPNQIEIEVESNAPTAKSDARTLKVRVYATASLLTADDNSTTQTSSASSK